MSNDEIAAPDVSCSSAEEKAVDPDHMNEQPPTPLASNHSQNDHTISGVDEWVDQNSANVWSEINIRRLRSVVSQLGENWLNVSVYMNCGLTAKQCCDKWHEIKHNPDIARLSETDALLQAAIMTEASYQPFLGTMPYKEWCTYEVSRDIACRQYDFVIIFGVDHLSEGVGSKASAEDTGSTLCRLVSGQQGSQSP